MKKKQQGFVAIYLSLVVLFVLSGIGAFAFLLISSQQRIIENTKQSLQAYYGAEAGIEDALFRIKESLNWANPGTLGVLGASVSTTIADTPEGKLVVAEGNDSSRIRRVQALFRLSGVNPQFFYGAHVGEGGLIMDNNSRVEGNVFSNGNITATGKAKITDTASIAGVGGTLSGVEAKHAFVDNCTGGAEIKQELHSNSTGNCTFGSFIPLGTPLDPVPLPVTSEMIQQWKDEAAAGGTTGTIELDGSDTLSLGPIKIEGNLSVENSAVLTLTGNIWVTGSVEVENSGQVRLDPSFGISSGVVVADGNISLENSSVSLGSGVEGSYLMYLTTNTGNAAFEVKNNAIADIVYAFAGGVSIENNTVIKEITGYLVHAKNNAVVTFETGLQSATFTSGSGAGWELVSWKEVE